MAETIDFDGGRLSVAWETDSVCTVYVHLDEASGTTSTGVWVVTMKVDRFDDGIFAWQLHWSTDQANVIVLPNDFLTSRAFSLEQLGITVVSEVDGTDWTLHIPRNGLIPELVVPGDRLEVHALWMQQEPLAGIAIPAADSVPLAAVAGGGGTESAPPTNPPDTVAEPTTDPLPSQTTFVLGDPIVHRFLPIDPATGLVRRDAHATATLLRVYKDKGPELMIYKILTQEEDGSLRLRMETKNLDSGIYELYIWVSGEEHARSMQLELAAAMP